jgi:NitT/TauT family transport system ATP-binding protein
VEIMSAVLTFDNVVKRYGRRTVLGGVSFDVNAQDVVGIFGQSGSGKTTILKLAAGLLTPDGGTVGRGFSRIGYAFQEPRVLPWQTTLDNVIIPLLALGLDRREAEERARMWIDDMGLSGFEKFYPSKLSGGMVQRVSLARAFAVEPGMLFLDEPFGSLDIRLKDSMFDLLRAKLDSRPVTVLYVSHVPEDVIRIATRIFVLDSSGMLREAPVTDHDDLVRMLRETFEDNG